MGALWRIPYENAMRDSNQLWNSDCTYRFSAI